MYLSIVINVLWIPPLVSASCTKLKVALIDLVASFRILIYRGETWKSRVKMVPGVSIVPTHTVNFTATCVKD
jgi:hypothetical protein